MTGSGINTCTLALTAAAPSGGFSVDLTSSNAAVGVPTIVTVTENSTSASFTATVAAASTTQTVTLTASAKSVSQTFVLRLNAVAALLSVNASNVTFGTVLLNSTATQSVILTSIGTLPVTVSAAQVTGSGFTIAGSALPVTLAPGESSTLTLQFDPSATGTLTGQLTIQSNSSLNATALVSLSGTGTDGTYQVELTWDAPVDTTDPAVGYNIYRSSNGNSAYVRLNSSLVTDTVYTDFSVTSGQSYDYLVTSVDAAGIESTPSNLITVTIP